MASSPAMRDLGRRLLVGLAVAVAAVAAVGYGLIATNIASPIRSDLGTVVPPEGPGARAVLLADGRPAFVVRTEDAVHVVDARVPRPIGAPGRLALWCGDILFDTLSDTIFHPDGAYRGGTESESLVAYPWEATDESRIVVGADGAAPSPRPRFGPQARSCDPVVHRPEPGEIFDPSVAAEEEPPGWIWLEGRLEVVGDAVALCDDVIGVECPDGVIVPGVDPAQLLALNNPVNGLFLGRLSDGVFDQLHYVSPG